MTCLEQAEKTTTTAYSKAKAGMALFMEQVFQLYSNLIAEKARQPWTKIMTEQIDAAPWIDIQHAEHAESHGKLWDSFMECVRLHLLTMFHNNNNDGTERYYISNCLKKPGMVPIRQFVQQVQQLKSYLDLHCLFFSPQATKLGQK